MRPIACLLMSLLVVANAAAAVPPNVLFIVADDLNVALGAYSDSAHPNYANAKTPHLDRLAAEGIRFDRAYVQNPLCNPSRTSFLSGLRPPSTDVYDGQTEPRHKIGDLVMLPEHFRKHGYFTARVGKIAHNRFEESVRWDVSSMHATCPKRSGSTMTRYRNMLRIPHRLAAQGVEAVRGASREVCAVGKYEINPRVARIDHRTKAREVRV